MWEVIDSIIVFWLWCCKINLALMLFSDYVTNEWSKPQDYAHVVLLGPLSLAMIVRAIIDVLIQRYKQKG